MPEPTTTIETLFDSLSGNLKTARAGAELPPATGAVGTQLRKIAGFLGKNVGKVTGGLTLALILNDIRSKVTEGRGHLLDVEEATRPPTAEAMLSELDEQRRRQAAVGGVAQNNPELLENLRQLLSGQQKPDLTPNQVMFGATPTTRDVPPEALQEALAAMMR